MATEIDKDALSSCIKELDIFQLNEKNDKVEFFIEEGFIRDLLILWGKRTENTIIEFLKLFIQLTTDYEYGSDEIQNQISASRVLLDNLLKDKTPNQFNSVPLQTIDNCLKSFTSIINFSEKIKMKNEPTELKIILKLISQFVIPELSKIKDQKMTKNRDPSYTDNRNAMQEYFYGHRSKLAYIIKGKIKDNNNDNSDDEDEDENESEINKRLKQNTIEMETKLKECGYDVKKLDSFSKDLNLPYVNYCDVLIYYTGEAKIGSENELYIGGVNFNNFISKFEKKEKDIEKELDKSLSTKLGKYSVGKKSLFTMEFKKAIILDIINSDPISNLIEKKKPTFPSFKNCAYLYSNLSSNIYKIIDNKEINTTIFTQSLINRITDDTIKEGRDLSSISKLIQYDVVKQLKIINPPNEFDTTKSLEGQDTLKNEMEIIKTLFKPISDQVFCKILLNCYQVLYGDASNGDFLINDVLNVKK